MSRLKPVPRPQRECNTLDDLVNDLVQQLAQDDRSAATCFLRTDMPINDVCKHVGRHFPDFLCSVHIVREAPSGYNVRVLFPPDDFFDDANEG